jgi:hypothetical protein
VNVTDNHFVSDFFRLNQESSSFEIAAELSFQDREFIFNDLPSWINNIIELLSHLPTICSPDYVIIPGANWDNRIGVKVFPDQSMNCFRVVSFIHDVTIGLSDFMTLSEQSLCMPSIVDPAFRGYESGNHLLFGINGYRSFQEMFSDFTGSFRKIMAAVPARKTGRIDCRYGNNIVIGVEQVHRLSECDPKINRFYP